MDLVTLTVVSCLLSLVCMVLLGAGVWLLVTRGGSKLLPGLGGMFGLGGADEALSAQSADRPRADRRRPSRNLRERAQGLSFDEAVQRQGGNLPQQMNAQAQSQGQQNQQQQPRRQNRSLSAPELQPSRPALSPSRPYQGSSRGQSQNQQQQPRRTPNQQRNQQRNQPRQRQSGGRPDFQPPQNPPPGNWGDTLSGQQTGQNQQQQNRQQQSSQNQQQQQNQPALRGGQRWQGNNQPPRSQPNQQQQNQQNQNQSDGLGDYRPPLRPRPTAEGDDSSSNKYNRGRDSRFGDDYDRIYIDGGEW